MDEYDFYDRERYIPYPVCNICGKEIDEQESPICDNCTRTVESEDEEWTHGN